MKQNDSMVYLHKHGNHAMNVYASMCQPGAILAQWTPCSSYRHIPSSILAVVGHCTGKSNCIRKLCLCCWHIPTGPGNGETLAHAIHIHRSSIDFKLLEGNTGVVAAYWYQQVQRRIYYISNTEWWFYVEI
jgi:hypothetical protein